MCGICGLYSTTLSFSSDELLKMTSMLAHRGPDAQGLFIEKNIGLGHTRLSILDTSAEANQPMHTADSEYVISYNGEVYNFKELAKEFNLSLKTTSDTEVILVLFIKLGVNFVHRLNGMFAIAIYHKQTKQLFIFRDRMGIKPLFYYWNDDLFAFASELKALTKIDSIKQNLTIRKKSVSSFLQLGYVPAPYSIFENIYKFPSGHYAIVQGKSFTLQPYWQIEEQLSKEIFHDFNSAKSEFKKRITGSVQYRLISDVPYGSFLSGGVDSSTITAIAQQLTGNIKTFSIGFNESIFDESKYAKEIANYLGTQHYEYIATWKDAIALIEELNTTYDEPFADSSAIPTMLLSRFAKQHVKMTLSGDGGDELFFGYGAYRWADRLHHPLIHSFRKVFKASLSMWGDREKRVAELFNYADKKKIKSHIFSQEQYFFSEQETHRLLNTEYINPLELKEDYSQLNRSLSAKEEQALFDMNYYLQDDLLVKVDRASMKYGLEVRVPFLDYRIVEFALNLSPQLKSKNGVDKFLLKETLYDFVPKKYFQRPKRGFAIPLSSWLRNELRYLIQDYLNEKTINELGIVNYRHTEELKNKFFAGQNHLYNRIWVLILLHKFFMDFKNK
jgi:asparagine synthase (glutamine-hydrolysing)